MIYPPGSKFEVTPFGSLLVKRTPVAGFLARNLQTTARMADTGLLAGLLEAA
jgi:hypothetical protein